MKLSTLHEMDRLTSARLDAEKAKLAKLTREVAEIEQQVRDLRQQRKDLDPATRAKGDTAMLAGADVRWHQWVESRVNRLGQNMEFVQAKRARQLETVRAAFGRQQAVHGLIRRAISEVRLEQSRAEWHNQDLS